MHHLSLRVNVQPCNLDVCAHGWIRWGRQPDQKARFYDRRLFVGGYLLRSDKPHDLPLKTIPMSDVFLLYLFEIFEEENGIERVFPPSL